MDRPLVLATRNRGKIAEFTELFKGSGIEVRTLDDFGPIPQVVEDGETFEDNAVIKARFTARVLGLPAVADDSGLTVKAIGGEPGVFSARYAGEGAGDMENNLKLLERMKGIEERNAAFICILAIAVPRGPALIYEGICEGVISTELMGSNGFGYDPLFYYPPLQKTFAQMTRGEKNQVSHRGKVMQELRGELDKVCIWLRQRLSEEPF
ncbi:MAG: Non-canonical purine NTP pyrophosphatase [Desulfococcus sp. 4484_242]|nr:MAG: Non-canonical purine NTP pyrophosphatase [Desulfococcus sp. 4484_242]